MEWGIVRNNDAYLYAEKLKAYLIKGARKLPGEPVPSDRFVTGGAALLMEWGIVRNNDAYLYAEKLKAYLIKGARKLPGEPVPSDRTGWGALCVKNSIPL